MNCITGIWDVRLRTPLGTLDVVYTFDRNGEALAGRAEGLGEEVPLTEMVDELHAEGRRVTWRQAVTKPVRLNLEFDVVVDGDVLEGHSRAGRLPRTRVSGTRRAT